MHDLLILFLIVVLLFLVVPVFLYVCISVAVSAYLNTKRKYDFFRNRKELDNGEDTQG